MEFYDLPIEIIFEILGYVSLKDVCNISNISQYGRELCKNDYIWKDLTNKFYYINHRINEDDTWYRNFIDMYITPQQLQILKDLNNESPAHMELLKHLRYCDTYKGTNLDEIIVTLKRDYNNIGHCSICVPLHRNNVLLLEIYIEDTSTSKQFHEIKISEEEYYRLTNKKIMFIKCKDTVTTLLYLTKPQLNSLQYVIKFNL